MDHIGLSSNGDCARFAPAAIAVAPNGGRRGKADHPRLPLTADELAREASACLAAGAAMIHLHVRTRAGAHSLDPEAYRAATAAIRAAVGERLVVQISSEAVGLYSPAEQRAAARATRPEAISLALREFVPDASEEAAFAEFLAWMKRERILPQIILYAPAEAVRLDELRRRGVIPWPDVPVLYVLGRYGAGEAARPADLLPFLAPQQPRFAHWSACAFGRRETACVVAAATFGGHARVGFENNLCLPDGRLADDNAALVAAARRALESCGLSLCSADALRSALVSVLD